MSKNDGGSAFPQVRRRDCEGGYQPAVSEGGMSLRDWFAGEALRVLIEHHAEFSYKTGQFEQITNADSCAKIAYAIADAMLRERKREEKD